MENFSYEKNLNGKYIYIRHGQTDYNKNSRISKNNSIRYDNDYIDCILNETGISQAKSIQETLKTLKISKVYCSPLRRCLDTCLISLENHPNKKEIKSCNFFQNIKFLTVNNFLNIFINIFFFLGGSPDSGVTDQSSLPKQSAGSAASGGSETNGEDDDLGPLPPNWEKSYTEKGEPYFIDHSTGKQKFNILPDFFQHCRAIFYNSTN